MNNEVQQISALVEDFASRLAEHGDSVRIFITKQSDEGASGTLAYTTGRGNLYAQIAQTREWIMRQDQLNKLNTALQFKNDLEDGNEE